jgi:hypothetical protein
VSARKTARSVNEAGRDKARAIPKTKSTLSHATNERVEMFFAHLKRILKLDRLRLRVAEAKDSSY